MINLIILFIFVLGVSVVLFLSLIGKIHLSLLFLIPLFPLQNVIERLKQFSLGKDFIDIIIVAMVLGWVFRSIYKKEKLFEQTPFNKILFIMIIFTYISLWQGSFYLNFPAPINTSDIRLQDWKNYIIFPLIFFIIVNNIKNLKQIKWLIVAMTLGMLIVNYYTGNQIKWMPGLASREKIVGTFVWTGVNALAAFFAQYPFVLLGILIVDKQKIIKAFFLGVFIVSMYILLFLYSRGAYVAVIMGFLALCVIRKRIFLVPLIILLIFWQSILPKNVIERITDTKTDAGTLDPSSQQRIEIWKESLKLFKQNIITGVGFDVFAFLGFYGSFTDTHNIYVKILVEQGLIGITLFLILFWLALRSGWKLYKSANDNFLKGLGLGFIACVIATMTTNFFGDRWTYLQLGAYYWAFLGLVVRGNIIVQQDLDNKQTLKKRKI